MNKTSNYSRTSTKSGRSWKKSHSGYKWRFLWKGSEWQLVYQRLMLQGWNSYKALKDPLTRVFYPLDDGTAHISLKILEFQLVETELRMPWADGNVWLNSNPVGCFCRERRDSMQFHPRRLGCHKTIERCTSCH